MIRRRRPKREIEFSFDSFLDVVANVVGIVLRLIMVAWLAGRGYKAALPPPPPPPPELADPAPLPDPSDPRGSLRAGLRRSIDLERRAASEREAAGTRRSAEADDLQRRLEEANRERETLLARRAEALAGAEKGASSARAAALSLAEIKARTAKLAADLEAQRKLPPLRKTLHYRTPVSAEVQTEEAMFECRHGRVTLIDTQALVKRAKAMAQERSGELRSAWEIKGLTPPSGAFRLRFTASRERSSLDGPSGLPASDSFRYGLSGWELVPEKATRGEDSARALATGSDFRRVVDGLDPKQTAVTLWVYPDSFALYRALRDWLHDRDVVVAGRPLPEGHPIGSSRTGTASRGQ